MGAHLEFGILGPLEVRHAGLPVPTGGPRQRALLALLLCNANRVVSRDRLVDELLSGQPADTAERLLRVQVSRLRKALAVEGDAPRLIARPPGYLLRVEPGELDLHEFERLLAAGRQALETEDPRSAAAILREAESLWRGRPLADLEFEPFARLEVERLEQLRLLAVEERIAADLELGRHGALCPELEVLVEEHPLRERLRAQLMIALYRSGRQADALAAYRTGRSRLVDDLGLEPDRQLRQLEQSILEHDLALELPPSAREVAAATDRQSISRHEPPPVSRRDHRRWLALALAVAAALAVLAIVPALGSSARRRPRVAGNVLALLASAGDPVQATVRLPAAPTDVTAGFGSLWAAERGAGNVLRVDPEHHSVVATIPVGAAPGRLIVGGGRVWVLDPVSRTVSAIDPSTDTVAQTVAAGPSPTDLAFSAGSLWITERSVGTVIRLEPATGDVEQTVRTGGGPSGIASADGALWVATQYAGAVDRVEARTGAVTSTVRLGGAPADVVATPTAVWILNPPDATVSRIDPTRDAVVATVPIGGAPVGMSMAGHSLWIAGTQPMTLQRLDTDRDAITRTVRTDALPVGLATDDGAWVAADAAPDDHRGGTLTATSFETIDTIDPAASTSTDVSPPQFLGLSNDGLVTLDHVSGPAGTGLVPDLATSVPVPGDGGRTYTFHLRPGIRYSTGVAVRPSDVTRSFERLFAIGSSGASWFGAITGADACARRPSRCDLSRGIVADDQTGTVTFRLTRPDPDFLFKLTLTFADVLPGSIPDRQARSPLPATGPYEISRYVPGQEVLLTRNPRFREWSAAAQPAGYPNRIVLQLDATSSSAVAAVASGRTDFMSSLGPVPGRYARYFLGRAHDREHVKPLVETSFAFLNVRVPPFNDVRVRRALNLALDRRRIVSQYGGPLAARPTCQVLPPGIAGYTRYCPYTVDPSVTGAWSGPDLTEARRLVAASGTRGMRVTVWNISGPPPAAVDETRDAVAALRELGYRATLRLLPQTTYFTYTNDSRNRAQVIDGGWSADYASADDFIGKLTCRYFVARDGLDTIDASEFCSPAIDREATRAASLQSTDPGRADALWARLDRKLTDLAIWLPTVTPDETDLTSARVGNYLHNPIWGVLLDQLWVR